MTPKLDLEPVLPGRKGKKGIPGKRNVRVTLYPHGVIRSLWNVGSTEAVRGLGDLWKGAEENVT